MAVLTVRNLPDPVRGRLLLHAAQIAAEVIDEGGLSTVNLAEVISRFGQTDPPSRPALD